MIRAFWWTFWRAFLIALWVLLVYAFVPAHARSCPHGQILRVSLHQCVDRHSALAHNFRRMVLVAEPPPPEPPHRQHEPLTYVQVIEPEIDIPYAIPSSRLNRRPVVYFDKLPQ